MLSLAPAMQTSDLPLGARSELSLVSTTVAAFEHRYTKLALDRMLLGSQLARTPP